MLHLATGWNTRQEDPVNFGWVLFSFEQSANLTICYNIAVDDNDNIFDIPQTRKVGKWTDYDLTYEDLKILQLKNDIEKYFITRNLLDLNEAFETAQKIFRINGIYTEHISIKKPRESKDKREKRYRELKLWVREWAYLCEDDPKLSELINITECNRVRTIEWLQSQQEGAQGNFISHGDITPYSGDNIA